MTFAFFTEGLVEVKHSLRFLVCLLTCFIFTPWWLLSSCQVWRSTEKNSTPQAPPDCFFLFSRVFSEIILIITLIYADFILILHHDKLPRLISSPPGSESCVHLIVPGVWVDGVVLSPRNWRHNIVSWQFLDSCQSTHLFLHPFHVMWRSLSYMSLEEMELIPWRGHQSATGPHKDKWGKQLFTLMPTSMENLDWPIYFPCTFWIMRGSWTNLLAVGEHDFI